MLVLKIYQEMKSSGTWTIFEKYENQSFIDSEYFHKLVAIIFYSGFRASTVTSKMSTIQGYFSDYKEVANYGEN